MHKNLQLCQIMMDRGSSHQKTQISLSDSSGIEIVEERIDFKEMNLEHGNTMHS